MLQQATSGLNLRSRQHFHWRKFDANTPLPHEVVEIRRHHDDKTILRRRADLSPAFDWRHAEWRPL